MRSPSSSAPPPAASPKAHVLRQLLPIALAVFVGFLTIGLPLPVLPLHLHDTLGMGTLAVGVVIGAQFAAALLSRAWAGAMADTQGARRAVIAGLVLAACSGLAYLASLAFVATPATSVGVLLLG
ncbi:MAG: arabinose transporter, partial [Comamonas sp.]